MNSRIKKTSQRKRKVRKKKKGLGEIVLLKDNYQGNSNLKWKVIGWSLGFIGLGAAGFFGYRWYKNNLKGSVEEKSLSIGNPENYAMHLKKAFDNDGWPGTNNDAVFKTFEDMPSYLSFLAMKKAYYKLTGKVFEDDLDDEMSLKEVMKIEDILKKKPDVPKSGISLSPAKS